MAFCPYCGTPVDGKFCANCGQPFPDEDVTAVNAVEEAAAPAAPTYEAPAYEAPAYEAPAYEVPVYEAPVDTKMTMTAFIVSIIGLCLSWIPWFIGFVCAAPAVVFTIIAWVKKSAPTGKRIAATVMTGVAVMTALIMGIVGFTAMEVADEYYDDDHSGYADDYIDYDADLSTLYYLYCDADYAVYSDTEDYLYIDTNPHNIANHFESDAWDAIQEVNEALGLPDSVSDDMYSTTSRDGEQYEFFDDISIMWTYHPDEGLEVIYMED